MNKMNENIWRNIFYWHIFLLALVLSVHFIRSGYYFKKIMVEEKIL